MNVKIVRLKNFMLAISFLLIISCEKENIEKTNITQNSENFISEETAVTLSKNIVFSPDPASKNQAPLKKNIKEVKTIKDADNKNLFYIINYNNGGFVILSADNRLSPVLAYSDNSAFRTDANDYSSGLVKWIKSTSDTIKSLRKSGLKQSTVLKKEWTSFNTERSIFSERSNRNTSKTATPVEPNNPNNCKEESEIVGPLLKTTWHQGCGFNDLLEVKDCTPCGRIYAGCVPIAIAQVMKYHAFPASYNWANMPNAYGTASTATLLKDIHTAIGGNISSDCDGTSVSKDYDISGVFTSFNYTSAIKANYNSETVKQQLRLKRPVILSAGTTENFLFFKVRGDGHMWVCDGFWRSKYCIFDDNGNYQSSGESLYLSMNWGWQNGYENGWYAYNSFNPNGSTYNFQIKMVYNIKP